MINNIIQYIKALFLYNNKKIEEIYLNNSIILLKNNNIQNKNEINYKGFYFYGSYKEEYDILNIYLNMTGSWPTNTNILICNKDISFEEITTFIKRAIYCKINCLFMVVVKESFESSNKAKLINLLRKKAKIESQMMISCLIIFFNLNDKEFHQYILKIKNINSIDINNFSNNKINQKSSNIINIISSTMCGQGKSTYINDRKPKNGEIIYLPIGGDLKTCDLVERLKEAIPSNFNDSINYILHIDLGQTNDIEIVKDFLFKLLILNKCEIDENVI